MSEIDAEHSASKAFKEKMNSVILAGCTLTGLALGSELGLFKAMSQLDRWATSTEIAEASKCKERYIREWLYQMSSCEVIHMKEDSEHFFLPEDHRDALIGHVLDGSMVRISRHLLGFACTFPQLQEAFKENGPAGVDFSLTRIGLKYWEEDRDMGLMIDAMIPKLPEDVVAKLGIQINPTLPKGLVGVGESGISCCDVGGGIGTFALELARRFPNSQFTSCDYNTTSLDKGRAVAARLDISNVKFVFQDLRELFDDWTDKFDLVTMMNVLHDLPDPLSGVRSLHRMLKPGCYLALVDVKADSNPHATVLNRSCAYPAPLIYTASIFHCLPSCLAYPGAAALGTAVGYKTLTTLLNEGGFSDVKLDELLLDHLFICKKTAD